MMTAECHVVGDELALSNEVVILDGEVTAKVGPDGRDDLLPTLSTLASGPGGMVQHVFSDQLVDHRLVTCRPTPKQLFNHRFRLVRHDCILLAVECLCTQAGCSRCSRRDRHVPRLSFLR
jgi:hypothetical protein